MSQPKKVHPALWGWQQELIGSGRSRGTIKLRIGHAQRFLEWINKPLPAITRQDMITWLAHNDQWAKDTRRSCVASFRGLWKWAVLNAVVPEDITISLPKMPRQRPLPRPAADYDVMEAMKNAPEWVRFAMEIMATCGLRRAEVAYIKSSDVQPEGQGWTITVKGKGDVMRVVPCPPHIAMKIKKRGGWAFPGGQDGHVSPGWMGKQISKHLPPGVTGHKLRHRFASVAYSHTHDLRAIQELLGHASVATTQVYVRVSTHDTRATAETTWKIAA